METPSDFVRVQALEFIVRDGLPFLEGVKQCAEAWQSRENPAKDAFVYAFPTSLLRLRRQR